MSRISTSTTPEQRAFRDRVVGTLSRFAPAVGATIDQQREQLEVAAARVGLPNDVGIVSDAADGVAAEWLRPAAADGDQVILYFHGGGYCIGSLASTRPLVAHLVSAVGIQALSVGYRLAPEHPYPAALDDAVTAYRWLLRCGYDSCRVVVAGDSAGAGLAVTLSLVCAERALPRPAACVCLSPWVDLASDREHPPKPDDPQVAGWRLTEMARLYAGGNERRLPLISPLFGDLAALPPLLIQVGACELLIDDAMGLGARATSAGIDVTVECYDAMFHVWHAIGPRLDAASIAFAHIGDWLASRAAA